MKVKSAYVQSPFKFTYRDIELSSPGINEALIDISACGICGFDVETSGFLAPEPRPFGHEIVGVVRELGDNVKHVSVGDQVALESSSFCCDCSDCRNGRVDLCNRGAQAASGMALGFSEAMIAPARCLVPAPDIDAMKAVLTEPCGVAIDVIETADIGLTDKVLIVGAGSIGLMILAIARRLTTGSIVVANPSKGRLEKAKQLGADAVFSTKETGLVEIGSQFGGFDRILVTAPPQVLPDCISAAAFGGYIVFIGSDFRDGGVISLDTHALHFGKKQLRSSFASPALYFPQALHLLRTGVVPAEMIVTHKFPLSKLSEAMETLQKERDTTLKIAIIPDSKFQL